MSSAHECSNFRLSTLCVLKIHVRERIHECSRSSSSSSYTDVPLGFINQVLMLCMRLIVYNFVARPCDDFDVRFKAMTLGPGNIAINLMLLSNHCFAFIHGTRCPQGEIRIILTR